MSSVIFLGLVRIILLVLKTPCGVADSTTSITSASSGIITSYKVSPLCNHLIILSGTEKLKPPNSFPDLALGFHTLATFTSPILYS